jgi:phosphopantetheinyl transferase (holo-ACP synthase)
MSVEKRRRDYLVGRATAKLVVARAVREWFPDDDWPPGDIELPADPGGVPYARLAPEAAPRAGLAPGDRLAVSVSISHTEGRALCAATLVDPGAPRRAIGVDLGRIEPRSAELQTTFFTDAERSYVHAASPDRADLHANLVWCAKEAVLKVLGVGLAVDTFGLTCLPESTLVDPGEWPFRPDEGRWRRFSVVCAPTLLAPGGVILGAWRELDGFVGAVALRSA